MLKTLSSVELERRSAPSEARENGNPANPWHAKLAPYRHATAWKSIWQLINTLIPLVVSFAAVTYFVQGGSLWAIPFMLLSAGLLVRVFVLQHDCGHRSFFNSVVWCDRVGSVLGIFTATPYHTWRRLHAVHHATSGDLDRRGKGGEIFLLTVEEYKKLSFWGKVGYRLYRNPVVLFIVGPFYQFVIKQRLTVGLPKTWKRERLSVHFTNFGILALWACLSLAVGWQTAAISYLCVVTLAATAGVWLFYVQHQYEDGYFERKAEWDYVDAALKGSSHFRLPKPLQWMTANIGIHHVHHLDSRIPNYRLQQVIDEQPGLAAEYEMSLTDGIKSMSYKLWDEKRHRLIPWSELRESK